MIGISIMHAVVGSGRQVGLEMDPIEAADPVVRIGLDKDVHLAIAELFEHEAIGAQIFCSGRPGRSTTLRSTRAAGVSVGTCATGAVETAASATSVDQCTPHPFSVC